MYLLSNMAILGIYVRFRGCIKKGKKHDRRVIMAVVVIGSARWAPIPVISMAITGINPLIGIVTPLETRL